MGDIDLTTIGAKITQLEARVEKDEDASKLIQDINSTLQQGTRILIERAGSPEAEAFDKLHNKFFTVLKSNPKYLEVLTSRISQAAIEGSGQIHARHLKPED